MDGSDGIDAFVRAVAITLLVCIALAVVIPTAVTIRATRANAPRPWLVFMLTLIGVVSAEIVAVVTFLVLRDETDSGWAIVVFGAVSVAAFVALRAARVEPSA